MIRFLSVALVLAGNCTPTPALRADDAPVKTRTEHTFADGRKVIIEESAPPRAAVRRVLVEEPLPVVRVRSSVPVYVEETPVVIRRSAVAYTTVPAVYAAPPVLLAPARVKPTPFRDFLFGR